MEWRDEGVILAVRRHGETSAIAEVLTADHGRCLGLVRGGRSRRMRPVLQPGNAVSVIWRARLEEHLGNFTVEALNLWAGAIMENPFRLAGLSTLCGLSQVLPEREPHPRVYTALRLVMARLDDDALWPALLVRWELGLLEELGFGLDLGSCAATGRRDELIYVSPKSGRAVSREVGTPHATRLLRLPSFLMVGGEASPGDIADGLKLTGYFLDRHVFEPRGLAAPEPRSWIIAQLAQKGH